MENQSDFFLNEQDKNLYRSYMNTKIDIFQNNDGYVFRNKNIHPFYNSYEHFLMQDSTASILSSSSNLIIYSLSKNYQDINKSRHELRKIFHQKFVDDPSNQGNLVEKKYKEFHNKTMREKLEDDEEYKSLKSLIDHPRFEQIMSSNHSFLRYILNHKYLRYHPRYEEIKEKYNKSRCPFYNQNSSENVDMDEDDEN